MSTEATPALQTPTSGSPEPVIETRNLSKTYRDFWGRQKVRALKALDLTVYRGGIFGCRDRTGRANRPPSSCC